MAMVLGLVDLPDPISLWLCPSTERVGEQSERDGEGEREKILIKMCKQMDSK